MFLITKNSFPPRTPQSPQPLPYFYHQRRRRLAVFLLLFLLLLCMLVRIRACARVFLLFSSACALVLCKKRRWRRLLLCALAFICSRFMCDVIFYPAGLLFLSDAHTRNMRGEASTRALAIYLCVSKLSQTLVAGITSISTRGGGSSVFCFEDFFWSIYVRSCACANKSQRATNDHNRPSSSSSRRRRANWQTPSHSHSNFSANTRVCSPYYYHHHHHHHCLFLDARVSQTTAHTTYAHTRQRRHLSVSSFSVFVFRFVFSSAYTNARARAYTNIDSVTGIVLLLLRGVCHAYARCLLNITSPWRPCI